MAHLVCARVLRGTTLIRTCSSASCDKVLPCRGQSESQVPPLTHGRIPLTQSTHVRPCASILKSQLTQCIDVRPCATADMQADMERLQASSPLLQVGTGGYCSPRHLVPSFQEPRVQSASDDLKGLTDIARATSQGAIEFKRRGFKRRWTTWRILLAAS